MNLEDDPELQEKIQSLSAAPVGAATSSIDENLDACPGTAAERITATPEGCRAGLIFLGGVVLIVLLGLFPELRPTFEVDGLPVRLDMTSSIVIVMAVIGVLIVAVGRAR